MAKDLGTITHQIKTSSEGGGGGKSNTDAVTGSGRQGGASNATSGIGGAGDVIRGLSRGGISGGGQAMAKVMGFAKLAGAIGLAIGAFALVTIAVKKVISVFTSWVKEIEAGIEKFSKYNAQLAMVQAMRQVGTIKRDVMASNVLSGGMAITGGSTERIRNAFAPVSMAFSALKTGVVNTFLPVIERLVVALRWLTVKVLDIAIWFSEIGVTIGGIVGSILDSFMGVTGFSSFFLGLNNEPTEADEKMLEELKRIREHLQTQGETTDGEHLNFWLSEVGRQLTDDKWSPFREDFNRGVFPKS